jgi:hypothetical protein
MSQEDIDKGLENYLKQIEELSSKSVKIGILADDADEISERVENSDGGIFSFSTKEITLFEKAQNVEYGIGQPKRPFMRTSFDLDENRIQRLVKKLDTHLLAGAINSDQLMDRVGQEHTNTVKTVMKKGRQYFQLNSEEWAAEKGGTPETVTPTIHTGQTRQAINFKVE